MITTAHLSRAMSSSGERSTDTMQTPRPSSRIVLIAIFVALSVSVTLNVLLAHRVRNLTYSRSASMAEYQLKVGTTVPPIAAKRLDGKSEVISYQKGNQPTVLYIFTPPCVWCARNMSNFKTLFGKESGEYRFIGLSLSEEGLAEYVAKNELKLPVYFGMSIETKGAYKLSGTPQTIVVSPEGRVLQSWMGAYVGDQKSQVEAFFHVTLPGLRTEPKPEIVSRSTAAPTE
jgi:peroxiredoxin